MRVQDILRMKGSKLISISQNASIREASKLISSERVGMLLVVDDQGVLVGVLSERDVLCVVASVGTAALDAPAGAAMADAWVTAALEDSVTELMRVMTERRARHMPVMSAGKLVGVISIGDILKSRLAEKDQEAEVLRDLARASIATST